MHRVRELFLLWAEPIGAVASVVIAGMAVWITIALEDAERAREDAARQFARTSAIHETYTGLDSVQQLSAYAHKLFYILGTLDTQGADEYWAAHKAKYDELTLGREPIDEDRFIERQARLTTFVAISHNIYVCGWSTNQYGNTSCDQDNLLEATIPDLAWIYFGNVHGLYCDEYIMSRFLETEDEGSPLYNLETMIMASTQLALESLGQSVPVFRSHAERGNKLGRYVRPNVDELCTDV